MGKKRERQLSSCWLRWVTDFGVCLFCTGTRHRHVHDISLGSHSENIVFVQTGSQTA